MKVELENLTKRWGSVVGADSINLGIQDGEFVAFLGPSGCGKTTTLLMIAGIYKPTKGTIRFDGHVVNQLAPKDRNVGMVFQSYALYPHMNVFQNISYPLKLKKVPKEEMREQAQRVADMMGIGHLMDRSTNRSPTWMPACVSQCAARSNGCKWNWALPPSMSPTTRWRP